MATYSLSEARAHLAEIVTKVENGDDVTITRHGRPVAYVVTPERWVQQKRLAELEQAHELHGDVEPAVELGLSIKPDYDLEAHIAEIRQAHRARMPAPAAALRRIRASRRTRQVSAEQARSA